MKSDQTPPFAQMVAQMFGQANSQQQAGMLNQLLASLGPGALAALASGAVGGGAGPSYCRHRVERRRLRRSKLRN